MMSSGSCSKSPHQASPSPYDSLVCVHEWRLEDKPRHCWLGSVIFSLVITDNKDSPWPGYSARESTFFQPTYIFLLALRSGWRSKCFSDWALARFRGGGGRNGGGKWGRESLSVLGAWRAGTLLQLILLSSMRCGKPQIQSSWMTLHILTLKSSLFYGQKSSQNLQETPAPKAITWQLCSASPWPIFLLQALLSSLSPRSRHSDTVVLLAVSLA